MILIDLFLEHLIDFVSLYYGGPPIPRPFPHEFVDHPGRKISLLD